MALRVPITAGPETTITIVFKSPIFGADLTTVRNAHLTVTRRDGSVVTWALTIISATPSELVTQYEFQGTELNTTGAYLLAPHFITSLGDILGQTITLFVTADAGFSAQTETSGWIAVTSPIATLGQVSGSWKRIAPSDSPYQASPISPWLAVDLSSGSVSTTLWSGTDGDVVLFSDYLDGAGVGGKSLTLIGKGVQRLPVGDGTYSSSVAYTGTGFQLGLKYSSALSEWLPWIRDARSATASGGGGGTTFTPVLPLRLTGGLLTVDPATESNTGSFSSQDKTILDGLPALIAGKVQSVSGTAGQISFTGTTNPIGSLVPSGVSAGTYQRATVTVDLLGRIVSASSGSASENASGTDGLVQFAKAGDFASDSNLFWDDTLKLLGIGTAIPETRLHVVAADGLIKPPTTASATLVVEPVLNSPTITSVTAIIGPDDPSSSGGTVNNDYPNPTPWTASGSDWGIIVYATLTVDGVQYTSPVGTTSDMGFDNGDSGFLSFSTSWAASSFGDGYKVVLTQNGSPVFYADVSGPGTTSYTFDENSVAAGGPNAFISSAYPYDPGITPPSPISSTFGASPQYGSGPYLADGNSYSYTIDGATFDPTTGLYYASGSPTGAGSFTDDGSFNQFYVEIDFAPPVGSNDNSIVQGQINGGSFFYFFGGNSGIANDFSGGVNDPTAEAAWLRTYPGNVGFPHNYDATGYATSPAAYYSTTTNGGSYGAINPVTGYMLQLGLSWGSTPNAKLRGSSTGTTTTGIAVNSTQTTLIDRPAIWGGDSTITPNHVGFVSGGQTETYHFYGRATSPTTYFSQGFTAAAVTFPNDSAYRYINLAWTNDASATSAKILRNTGSGFNTGYQGGFGQVFQTYTSSSPSWSDGTAITPNAIPGTAGLFEGATTTLSDSPQIVVRSTLSAAARIAFQNSSHVQTGTIGIDPANLTMRFISPAAIWEFGTSASQNLISLQTQSATFNLTNLSGYRFAINGFSEALFTVASSSHSVAIGAASNIGGGALVVEPVVNIPNIYLKLFGGGGANANFITGVKADNTAGFAVTHDGHISINGASDLAFLNIPAGTTTYGGIYITPGTLVSSPSSGLIEHDNSSFFVTQSGGRFRVAVGPVGGLTNRTLTMADGNGNLSDSPLVYTTAGSLFIFGNVGTYEFKSSISLDSALNIGINGTGQLQMNNGTAITAGTSTGLKIATSSSQKLGFFGVTPVVQQSVTGSRADGTALASLLTKLALEGLITDSSTTGARGYVVVQPIDGTADDWANLWGTVIPAANALRQTVVLVTDGSAHKFQANTVQQMVAGTNLIVACDIKTNIGASSTDTDAVFGAKATLGTTVGTNSTTLASAASQDATTISCTHNVVPVGSDLYITGLSARVGLAYTVKAISGSGPYTLTLDRPLARDFANASTVQLISARPKDISVTFVNGAVISGQAGRYWNVRQGLNCKLKGAQGSSKDGLIGALHMFAWSFGSFKCQSEDVYAECGSTSSIFSGNLLESTEECSLTRCGTSVAAVGIMLFDALNNTITDSYGYGNGQNIELSSGSTEVVNSFGNKILGGFFDGATGAGVFISQGACNNVIDGVTCRGNTSAGVQVASNSSHPNNHNIIANCVVTGSSIAVQVADNCKGTIINGLSARSNANGILVQGASDVMIDLATIEAVGAQTGIQFQGTSRGSVTQYRFKSSQSSGNCVGLLNNGTGKVFLEDALFDMNATSTGTDTAISAISGSFVVARKCAVTGSSVASTGILVASGGKVDIDDASDFSSCTTPVNNSGTLYRGARVLANDTFLRIFGGTLTADRTFTLPDASTAILGASNNLSDVASVTTARTNLSAAKSGANTDINSIVLQGASGAGFINYPTQSSNPANPTNGFTEFADASGRPSWKVQSDGFVRTFAGALTATRVYTLPDATTTIVGTDTTATLTNKTIDGGSNTLTNIANGSLSGAPTSSNTASTIALRDASGNFTMGALTASALISSAANPATSGAVRLATGDLVTIRDAGNTANKTLLSFDGRVCFGAANLLTAIIGGTGYFDVTDLYFRHQNTTEYIHFVNGAISFSQDIACSFFISDKTTANGTGHDLTIHAQHETGTGTTTGGNLILNAGTGTTTGKVKISVGSLYITTAGKGLEYQSGTNARAGNAVLVAGTVDVTNSTVTANTLVVLTRKTLGGVVGNLSYTVTAASKVTINSDNALDTSTVSYEFIEVN